MNRYSYLKLMLKLVGGREHHGGNVYARRKIKKIKRMRLNGI